jgi:hypothetical protein
MNFKNHPQEITVHSYIQYSGLIALSTVCLFQLYTDAHSTDTGLEESTSQIRFNTRSTLRSSTAKIPFTAPSTFVTLLYATHWLAVSRLRVSAGPICCLPRFGNFLHLSKSALSTRYYIFFSLWYGTFLAYQQPWSQRLRGSPHY